MIPSAVYMDLWMEEKLRITTIKTLGSIKSMLFTLVHDKNIVGRGGGKETDPYDWEKFEGGVHLLVTKIILYKATFKWKWIKYTAEATKM